MTAEPFSIRPLALVVRNFRGLLGEFRIELDSELDSELDCGLTLIVGENGTGKSSLLNAFEWCLFGTTVTKKGSGIDERAEWEVGHRDAEAHADVSVSLELEVDGGRARLTRTREAGAKRNAADHWTLELPGGEKLTDEEVADWLDWNHMPDWETWKHAFCQHQELMRARITNATDRSQQLGRLLGLQEYQDWNSQLRGLKSKRLEKTASEQLVDIEGQLQHALQAPGLELRDCEVELERNGVARSELNQSWLEARLKEMFASAAKLVKRMDLPSAVALPDSKNPEAVTRWSREFETCLQERCGVLDREVGSLRARIAEFETVLEGIEPARRKFEDAKRALEHETREHGGREQLARQLEQVGEERTRLREQQREHDRTLALLRDALRELERSANGDHLKEEHCPVCDSTSRDLKRRLVARVEAGEGNAGEGNAERAATEALSARESRLLQQQEVLAGRRAAHELAQTTHSGLIKGLEQWVEPDAPDPHRSAREKLRRWTARIEEIATVLVDARKTVRDLQGERTVLDLYSRWRTASTRTDAAAGDLGRITAWGELQATIDEAAELKLDLETLSALARKAQEDRSRERVQAVNATLGKHSETMTPGFGVSVALKSTATALKYRLVDVDGQEVLPTLNQAALNALSFAMLFAQSEDRAQDRLPAWLLLDDPGQSFDERALDGLARAILSVSERVPVVVASFPGQLADRLRKSAGCNVIELPPANHSASLTDSSGSAGVGSESALEERAR